MKWFIENIGEGREIRFLHGRVIDRPWNGSSVTMIVPFNIFARFVIGVWHALKFPAELWWERKK